MTATCAGPLLYLKQSNGTNESFVTATCSSRASSGNWSLHDWQPNATYMQFRQGSTVESIIDATCISVESDTFAKANCSNHSFGHYVDPSCTIASTASSSIAKNASNATNSSTASWGSNVSSTPQTISIDTIQLPVDIQCLVLRNASTTTPSPSTSAAVTSVVPASSSPSAIPSTAPLTTAAIPPEISSTSAPTSSPASPTASPVAAIQRQPSSSGNGISSGTVFGSFVVGCVIIGVLAVVYRKLRRRNNYLELRNPNSP
ncbi:hypothetical protein LEN26_013244 [Aphanomyces euteiches]|nr:hypothetical protein LEN26_013244 [Aphanomyces euteiches]